MTDKAEVRARKYATTRGTRPAARIWLDGYREGQSNPDAAAVSQGEYAIKLQRLIEAFCRWDGDPKHLPYPELHHHKKLVEYHAAAVARVLREAAKAPLSGIGANRGESEDYYRGVHHGTYLKTKAIEAMIPEGER